MKGVANVKFRSIILSLNEANLLNWILPGFWGRYFKCFRIRAPSFHEKHEFGLMEYTLRSNPWFNIYDENLSLSRKRTIDLSSIEIETQQDQKDLINLPF